MELTNVVTGVLGLVATGILGWLSYFIKRTLDEFKQAQSEQGERLEAIKKEAEARDKENEKRLEEVKQELSDLKADLPLIYVTREDYIRTMNNVDNKLDKIYDGMMRGGSASGRG